MPYVTLEQNTEWVKPIGTLEAVPEDGVTQDDFTAAETEAMDYTNAKVGWMYDISDWETTPPPVIELANKYLASAIAIDYYMSRDTDVTVGEEYVPDLLWARGDKLLDQIISAELEVVDGSGTVLSRLRRAPRMGPASKSSKATFFPDLNKDKSFGKQAPFTAESTFKRI